MGTFQSNEGKERTVGGRDEDTAGRMGMHLSIAWQKS